MVLELFERDRAFGFEADVEHDHVVADLEHLALHDLALFDRGERAVVQLHHLLVLGGRVLVLVVELGAAVGKRAELRALRVALLALRDGRAGCGGSFERLACGMGDLLIESRSVQARRARGYEWKCNVVVREVHPDEDRHAWQGQNREPRKLDRGYESRQVTLGRSRRCPDASTFARACASATIRSTCSSCVRYVVSMSTASPPAPSASRPRVALHDQRRSPRRSRRPSGWRPRRWTSRRRARSHGSAIEKDLERRRPGRPPSPCRARRRRRRAPSRPRAPASFTHSRTRGICATRDTCARHVGAAQELRSAAAPSMQRNERRFAPARSVTTRAGASTSIVRPVSGIRAAPSRAAVAAR